jgi:branched-chain amino acid transport system permease protein
MMSLGAERLSELAMVVMGGLSSGALYALVAIGIVVIYKATKTVNFAHGGFVLFGAFAAYLLVVSLGLSYWVAYIVVPILIGLLATVVELSILRPLRKADMFTVVSATIFVGIGLSELYRLLYNTEILSLPNPVPGAPFMFGDVIITREQLWVLGGALTAGLFGLLLFKHAGMGRSMRAMASNVRGAMLCGYSVNRVYALAWFVGGALAGLAGAFVGPIRGVSPELAISMVSSGFVAAVIGGFDSLRGAILGGLILGLSETFAAAYVSSAMTNAISFLLLFVLLLWRPQGLFPEGKVRDV